MSGTTTSEVISVDFVSYEQSVPALLDKLNVCAILEKQKQILLKPNLVNTSPPPVTTPVECCEALVEYIRRHSDARVVIAEGCGAAEYDTALAFEKLGYLELSQRMNVSLIDLNHANTVLVKRNDCKIFPEFHLPAVALESYIISVPVLKAHSLAIISGTMKNMMGFAPPAHYQCGGHWKKSAFHEYMHEAIVDLNRHVSPDLTLLDARTGLAEYHLGGAECNPPPRKLLASCNPGAADRAAAGLLCMDWRKIPHLL